MNRKLQTYHNNSIRDRVLNADSHKLIDLLLEGALEKINLSKSHMENGDIDQKCKNIGLAIDIIGGLQASLNKDEGGALAEKLDKAYSQMQARLLNANINNDLKGLDEVHMALKNIREGWNEIPDDVREKHHQKFIRENQEGNQ